MKSKLWFAVRLILCVGLAAAILAYGVHSLHLREPIDYASNLDLVAVTVDGTDLTLRDLYFYVLYEEKTVESIAEVYDKDQTRLFWNIHTNSSFVQEEAKDNVMGMAVHDWIMYQKAVEEHLVLSSEEKEKLESRRTDFWADLYDVQHDTMPVAYEDVNRTMMQVALAQKAQAKLAQAADGASFAGYNWDGEDYKHELSSHSVQINKKVWNRIIIGNVSLRHDTLITIDK
ncbi:MAG: hypothetical protein K6A05_04000 [Lachnospiraceae bacterium]|nr:hypothetical protein [Lachnospiraceae bacterium]